MAYYPVTKIDAILMHKERHQELLRQARSYFDQHGNTSLSSDIQQKIIRNLAYGLTIAAAYGANETEVLESLLPFINDPHKVAHKAEQIKRNLHIYKDKLEETLKTGTRIRTTESFPFPDIFNQGQRVYFAIDEAHGVRGIIQKTIDRFNKDFPEDLHLYTYIRDNKIWVKKRNQEYRPSAFFEQRLNTLLHVQEEFEKMPDAILTHLSELIRSSDTYAEMAGSSANNTGWLIEFKKKYPTCKLKKSDLRETLFYQLKAALIPHQHEVSLTALKSSLNELIEIYTQTVENIKQVKSSIHENPQENPNEIINRIVCTIVPFDIARVSTYVDEDIKSCFGMHHENYTYTKYHIGCGTIVVFGFNDKNPSKKLARVLLRPYRHEKSGAIMYDTLTHKGLNNPLFYQEVSRILRKEIQPHLSDGIFYLDARMHRERAERVKEEKNGTWTNICHFSSFESVMEHKYIPHTVLSDGTIKITNTDNRLLYSTNDSFVNPEKLDLSDFTSIEFRNPDMAPLKHLTLPVNGYSFKCSNKKNLPAIFDVSGFKNIDLSYSDLKGVKHLNIPATGEIFRLNNAKNVECDLDLSGFKEIKLENADLSRVKNLRLPQDWDGSLAGVHFPEKIYVENVLKDKGFCVATQMQPAHYSSRAPENCATRNA